MVKRKGTETAEERCLTPRQVQILTLIRDGRRRDGYSPTLQEIADELGISKITVFEHVESLIEKGLLTRNSARARSLEPTSLMRLPDERPTLLPMVGRIAAGVPIQAIENRETVDLEALFSRRYPVAALTVRGDSMVDDHICDGDLVVYETRPSARNGDVVVAVVNGEEATLKRFYKEKNRVRLQPANAKYAPIYSRDVTIQGVVIGVIRKFQ